MRLHSQLQRQFIREGGAWLAGDEVVKISHRQDAVEAVWTRNHGDIALRPRFTLLDNMMLRITGLYQMPDWKTALADYFSTKKGGAHK